MAIKFATRLAHPEQITQEIPALLAGRLVPKGSGELKGHRSFSFFQTCPNLHQVKPDVIYLPAFGKEVFCFGNHQFDLAKHFAGKGWRSSTAGSWPRSIGQESRSA